MNARIAVTLIALAAILPQSSFAQDRLKTMPGYEQFQKMNREISGSVKMGTLPVTWKDQGAAFEYQKDGKRYHYDIASGKAEEMANSSGSSDGDEGGGGRRGRRGGGGGGPARGRQFTSAKSPDGKLKAFYEDRNLWLSDADGGNKTAITTDGSEKDRIKYGTASWVYGEELDQTTAIWWS